jgi:zinc transporter 2
MAVEITGGIIAHSLAILTDAAHLMSDVFGVLISIFAIRLGRIESDKFDFSYGWGRAEIIGSLGSVILIWGLTAWLVFEAI